MTKHSTLIGIITLGIVLIVIFSVAGYLWSHSTPTPVTFQSSSVGTPTVNPATIQTTDSKKLAVLLGPSGITVDSNISIVSGRSEAIQIHWEPGASQFSSRLTLIERKTFPVSAPQPQFVEPTPDKLFVAALDSTNRLRGWDLISNPLPVRSELSNNDGVPETQAKPLSMAEIIVTIPKDDAITKIQLFKPIWTGQTFILETLGTVFLQ